MRNCVIFVSQTRTLSYISMYTIVGYHAFVDYDIYMDEVSVGRWQGARIRLGQSREEASSGRRTTGHSTCKTQA